MGAAQWTRDKNPPTVADFVNLFAELHECRSRARDTLEGEGKGQVWAHWPSAPGTMYCWKADNSALAVAYAFARMIETEVFCHCPVPYNVLSTPCDTPAFVQWRDKAIAGMGEKSLPPPSDWPRWAMHRDRQALLCKLQAEHGEAVRNAQVRTTSTPTDGATMPETTESLPSHEADRPTSIASQIEGLIADAETWKNPRVRMTVIGAPYPEIWRKEDDECQTARDRAAQAGKSIVSALVRLGESPRAVLTTLNALEDEDYEQAFKGWPAVKVELQEAAIRLRLRDDAARATELPAVGDAPISGNDPMRPPFRGNDPMIAQGQIAEPSTPQPESNPPRCAAMNRAEIARRLLNKPSARTREAIGLMKRHGLRHEAGEKYSICIDKLDPETKVRVMKPPT